MKRKIFSILFALVLVLTLSLVTAVPAAAAIINVPADYGTIQAAVNAANPAGGDTINVAAGDYDELLTISKGLTLLGANAGIHPAVGTHPTKTVGARSPESVITHAWYAFNLQADDITIDGFKFTGENGGAGQIIRSYDDANNFHLTNCIFDVSRQAVTSGWVLFGDSSHNDVLIDFNLFKDEKGDATLYFGGGSPSYARLRVAYNKFNAGGDAIYWATATPLVDGIVEGNEFDGTISGTPGQGGTGMNIGQGGNIIIRDNWFHDMSYTGFQVGIIGGSVIDNTFEDTYPLLSGGTWYASNAFELWGGEWGTPVSTNVTVSGNTIKFNNQSANADEHGMRLRSGADAPNIHVNCNNFIDGGISSTALAVRNQGTGIVDAEWNWWGDATGPYHPTLNAGGTGGAVSDDVDFKPWLLIAPPGGMCPPCLMTEFEIDHAKIDFKKKSDDDKVRVQGELSLGPCSNGVDISEAVTVTVGTLSETFTMMEKGKKGERWEYKRPKGDTGDIKHVTIDWKKGKFDIRMDKANLTGVTNPVTISIQIGDDLGKATIMMRVKKHHWDYKD